MIIKTYNLPNGATVRIHDDAFATDRDAVARDQCRVAHQIMGAASSGGKGAKHEQQADTDPGRR